MFDFSEARTNMVNCQLRTNDITDTRILDTMEQIPREIFLDQTQQHLAYLDDNVLAFGDPLQGARYMMSPVTMGRLLQLADVQSTDIVLDIGCMTGYSSALLAQLASYVVGVDDEQELIDKATDNMAQLDISNVSLFCGQMSAGHHDQKAYDVIFLNGSFETIPDSLFDLLGENGRLVGIEGKDRSADAVLYSRQNGIVSSWVSFNAALPILPGFAKKEQFVF